MKVNLQRPEAYVSGRSAYQSGQLNGAVQSDKRVTVSFLDGKQ